MRPPALVIFDCDGVLVDSEVISVSVLRDVLVESGLDVPEAVIYRRFLGRSMASVAEVMKGEYGLDITDAHLTEIRRRLYARFAAELGAVPGVAEVLRTLTMARCVASSSQPDRIRYCLRLAGLLECFEPRIYSSSMVPHGKPAPDLFLHAARSCGVEPARCLVIEDSPAGIEAARRAGMDVFAFVGASHAAPAGLLSDVAAMDPDAIFDDMRELPALIGGSQARVRTG